jgi:hypothetical protein
MREEKREKREVREGRGRKIEVRRKITEDGGSKIDEVAEKRIEGRNTCTMIE